MSTSSILTPESRTILRDYLLGGMGVGLAGGSAAALYNHLRRLKRKAEEATDTSGDDNALFVNVPKRASMLDKWTPGLAMVSAPLAAVGTAELVRRLYSRFRKKELQRELDEAQQVYLGALRGPGDEVKQANAVGMLEALPLFLMLGSGLITYETLKKNFPDVKPAQAASRPRLVVRRSPAPAQEGRAPQEQDGGMVKVQSVDADEHLLRTVLHLPHTGYIDTVVETACSPGGPDRVLKAASDGTIFDLPETGSTSSPAARSCAIGWLVRDPELAPVIKLACAAEIYEHSPTLVALGHEASDLGLGDDLRQLAALHTGTLRADWAGVKEAAMAMPRRVSVPLPQDPALVGDVLRQVLSQGTLAKGDPKETIQSLDSQESTDGGGMQDGARDEEKDLIDDLLAPQSPQDRARTGPRATSTAAPDPAV